MNSKNFYGELTPQQARNERQLFRKNIKSLFYIVKDARVLLVHEFHDTIIFCIQGIKDSAKYLIVIVKKKSIYSIGVIVLTVSIFLSGNENKIIKGNPNIETQPTVEICKPMFYQHNPYTLQSYSTVSNLSLQMQNYKPKSREFKSYRSQTQITIEKLRSGDLSHITPYDIAMCGVIILGILCTDFTDAFVLPNHQVKTHYDDYPTFQKPKTTGSYSSNSRLGKYRQSVKKGFQQFYASKFDPRNSNNYVEEITFHDGKKADLSNKSVNHLLANHGHTFGINDPLPKQPKRKSQYTQIKTKTNNKNRNQFRDNLKDFAANPKTVLYDNIKIRGEDGFGYFCQNKNNIEINQ